MGSPELQALREMLTQAGRMTPDVPLDLQRAVADAFGSIAPVPEEVTVAPVGPGEAAGPTGTPTPAGDMVAAPGARDGRVVLYLHGGGFVIGSTVSHRSFAAQLSAAAAATVLVLDYRRAPEHRYPAALDDAVGAFRWLLEAGADPGSLALAGDSAGGGLALAALVRLRDEGVRLPAATACISPWVDLRCTAASIEARAERDYVLSGSWLRAMAAHYLAGADPADPAVSPLLADLGGLPPVLVAAGSEEVLYDDAASITDRLAAAGVEAELALFEDCAHWWMLAGPSIPEAAACTERVGRFLGSRLA